MTSSDGIILGTGASRNFIVYLECTLIPKISIQILGKDMLITPSQ